MLIKLGLRCLQRAENWRPLPGTPSPTDARSSTDCASLYDGFSWRSASGQKILLKQLGLDELSNPIIGNRQKTLDRALVVPHYAGMKIEDAHGWRTFILYL
jgi:hypothetical protein